MRKLAGSRQTGNLPLRIAAVAAALLATAPLWACSVPVFRYALEKWQADPYEAIVFHRGPLAGEALAAVELLAPEGLAGEVSANLRVQTVDLDADPDADLMELWQVLGSPDAPHLAVRYPVTVHNPAVAWSVPLTLDNAKSLVDSPVRREIAQRLLKGQTAVWVLLEGGNEAENEKAYDTLAEELEKLRDTLELPEISAEDVAQGLVSVDPTELRVDFSIVRLDRENPQEQPLVHMLLGSEPDLREYPEPMAFPVFGRGRALYALVGAGINHEMIAQAGADLTGPCTCTVKEQNPGTDLLLAVDWNTLIGPGDGRPSLPPLVAVKSTQEPAEPEIIAVPPGRPSATNQDDSDAEVASETVVAASDENAAETQSGAANTDAAANVASAAGEADSAKSASTFGTFLVVGILGLIALVFFVRMLSPKGGSAP